jgi:uncharacterized protein (DUF2267 family)
MPLPFEYQNASRQFDQFMIDCRDNAGLATTNMTWNMVVGVLHAFRRRLPPQDALRFADVLPPVVRSVFVEHWDLAQPLAEFGSAEAMLQDVRAVRSAHNFASDNAIAAVAAALLKIVDLPAFVRVLQQLPPGAQAYWLGQAAAAASPYTQRGHDSAVAARLAECATGGPASTPSSR